MKSVEYIIGSETISNTPMQPYSEETLRYCATLSKNLLRSPISRTYPDIAALAFWCRFANLQKLAERCPEAKNRLGRGLCFHVTPGNIPINFAFSYLFGLLSGCANIVRLPSKRFPQSDVVCAAIRETLTDFPELEKRTALIRYPVDSETTGYFCAMADARLIWGGDATIAAVKRQPVRPRCVDICFADRYSICLIDGKAVEAAGEADLARLAEGFYNDTYLMDQNACSSPQLNLWLHDSEAARERFWDAVYRTAEAKYALQAAASVDKYTRLFEDALDGKPVTRVIRRGNLLYRVELSSLGCDVTALRGKCGYFYEFALDSLHELGPYVTDKFQTLTYFGGDPEELRTFVVEGRLRGVDRIVPIGKAMDIGLFWDGFDLIRMLSRYVAPQ